MHKIRIYILIISLTQIHAFEFRESSPERMFPVNQAASSISLPTDSGNPAMLSLIHCSYIHMSIANPYSIEGLYAHKLTIAKKLASSAMSISYFRFGIDEYNEMTIDTHYSRTFNKLAVGTALHYYRQQFSFGPHNSQNHLISGTFAFFYRINDWLNIAGLYDNLTYYRNQSNNATQTDCSAGISLHPMQGLSFHWNINKNSFGHMNSYSCNLNVLPFFAIKAGYIDESNSYSTACTLLIKNIYVSYGCSYHPMLGITHSFGVTYTAQPIRLTPLNYFPHYDGYDKQQLDIQVCTVEQLQEVPGLSAKFISRIITYRKTIGPLSIKAVKQISPDNNETKILLHHSFGYANYPSFKKTKKISLKKNHIFSVLLKSGIKPSMAFDLVVLIQKRDKVTLKKYIHSSSLIPNEEKELLYKRCIQLF